MEHQYIAVDMQKRVKQSQQTEITYILKKGHRIKKDNNGQRLHDNYYRGIWNGIGNGIANMEYGGK